MIQKSFVILMPDLNLYELYDVNIVREESALSLLRLLSEITCLLPEISLVVPYFLYD
jgi:hypothetical protein